MVQPVDVRGRAEICRQVAARLDELCGRYPRAAELHAAAARFSGPPRVAVSGRAGSGRQTLRTALEDRLGMRAIGVSADDADVAVHLLAAPPRAVDLAALAQLPTGRALVVLGKADAAPTEAFDQPGVVVRRAAPLLATLHPRDDELRLMRTLADCGVVRPMTAAAVVDGVPAEMDSAATELACRFGRGAMLITLEAVAARRDITAARLDQLLYERSGIAELLPPIRELAGQAVPQRLSQLAAELDRLATIGVARDDLEVLLTGELSGAVRSVS